MSRFSSSVHAPSPEVSNPGEAKSGKAFCNNEHGSIAARGERVSCDACRRKLHSKAQWANRLHALGVVLS